MKAQDISSLEDQLGRKFRNPELLIQALTHSSYAREHDSASSGNGGGSTQDNEQLEFLGDAVLSLVTSQALFERYPQFREGQLSKLRAHLVSEKHLIRAARHLHLGSFLRLGRGEEKSGGRNKIALQVDALEALLAAVYLDAGLDHVREFILHVIIEPEMKRLKKQSQSLDGFPVTDFKSALQEVAHSMSRPQPSYVLISEHGPEHQKTFTVEARVPSSSHGKVEYIGRGQGSTKKKAEQDAARQAIEYLWSLQTKPKSSRKRSS